MKVTTSSKDKVLFTPGPLTTSFTVKQAMLTDLGSRDISFIEIVRQIRQKLLAIGSCSSDVYTAVPMQGSGTFGIEAVVSSTIPSDGRLLVIANGAYGERIAKIANVLNINCHVLRGPEEKTPDLGEINKVLETNLGFTHVAVVHCETTTGIINPIQEIGEIVNDFNCKFFVDAMSSFGAVPMDLYDHHIDYLVSSSNKCLEGVPGFSFVIAKIDALEKTQRYARSLSLDLFSQWQGLERNGQFRFTPPTHALVSFHQALTELEVEGGVARRAMRYRQNHEILVEGMKDIGFELYLQPTNRSYIITSFVSPDHPNFDFCGFYQHLSNRGYLIYPGKVSNADCFRIGSIGYIFESDMHALLSAIQDTLIEMQVDLSGI